MEKTFININEIYNILINMYHQQTKKSLSRWEKLLNDVLKLDHKELYKFSVQYNLKLKFKLNGVGKR